MKFLTFLSKIPFIKRRCLAWLCDDIAAHLTFPNAAAVFFPDQYLLSDTDSISKALNDFNPTWVVGFVTAHTGNGYMTVFFVSSNLQVHWDAVVIFKNALKSRWLAYHLDSYLTVIRDIAARNGVPLLTDV